MKIAIDISSAVKPQPTGIGHFIVGLITALSGVDEENRYYLCCRLSRFIKYSGFMPKIEKPNFKRKIIQEPLNIFFPREIDVFHSCGSRLPNYSGPKLIVTFHDISLMRTGEFTHEDYREWKQGRYLDSAQRADKILTISEFSKKDILQFFQVSEEKVAVIHHGVDEQYYPRSLGEISAVKEKYSLKGDYVFSVGVGRRKNTLMALKAFRKVTEDVGGDIQFVLAGKFNQSEEYFKLAETPPLKGKVSFLGYVPDEDLPPLYSGARVFFFPSLYEGFGMPLLEAMASGCPVITSSVTSLPEVAGDAALVVNPLNLEEMSANLLKCVEEEGLRRKLVEKGLERVNLFTWEKAAQKVLALYRETSQGG